MVSNMIIVLGITASAALNLGTFGLEQPSVHQNQGMYQKYTKEIYFTEYPSIIKN